MTESDKKQELLKVYELVLESEDRYLERTEKRSRFYQVIASTLFGTSLVALLHIIKEINENNEYLIIAGLVVQLSAFLSSFVSIWALPGIYRVYRRSIWEAQKRAKIEMLMGLSPSNNLVKAWPSGLENFAKEESYLITRNNLGTLNNVFDNVEIDKRAKKGILGWNAWIFYILSVIGLIIAGACVFLEIWLLISFIIGFVIIITTWIKTFSVIHGAKWNIKLKLSEGLKSKT